MCFVLIHNKHIHMDKLKMHRHRQRITTLSQCLPHHLIL